MLFLREDVADQYSRADLADIAKEARFESIEAPMYEGMYSSAHGDLRCQVKWYDHVVELNFAQTEGSGIAFALEVKHIENLPALIAGTQTILASADN